MKKIYVLTVVCLCIAIAGMSQTFYWVGGTSNGLWSAAANWSATSGGIGGAGVPNSATTNVIFNTPSSVKLDFDIDLNSLSVTNSSLVKITATGGGNSERALTVHSTDPLNAGLFIATASRLEDSTEQDTYFNFIFAPNGQGLINGQWYLTAFSNNEFSYFNVSTAAGETSKVDVNGSITATDNGFVGDIQPNSRPYLRFNANSFLYLTGDGSFLPKATYNANSTVSITGINAVGVTIDELVDLGNVIYNCPNQSNEQNLGLLGSININGNLTIQNTNNFNLILVGNSGPADPVIVTVKGNLDISGTSSVIVSQLGLSTKAVNLFINGNLNAGGTKFDLQSTNAVTTQTVVFLKGNLQHTAGTFGASSTAVNESNPLFVLEMNGTALQTINSTTGTIDNTNNQVTLRMNNAAGVQLASPLAVGRIDFSGASHGILTTSTPNVLTIQNTSGNAIVVNSPGNTGYVNGPVRRIFAATTPMIIPTGAGGVYRELTLTPSSIVPTTFQANLINSAPSGGSIAPVGGVANYYWDISRIAGSANAVVQLAIAGTIPGTTSSEGLVVAKNDGTNWVTAKGSTGNLVTPGNTSTGAVFSEMQTSFGLYSIGFGNSATLPINLLSFTGKASGSSAELSWKITENSTPVKFEVLRSNDGKNFATIGKAAVSEGKLDYNFTDNTLLSGNNYYRLKMFDKDGTVSFSNIIVIMNGTKGVMISSMIPTLVRDRARLNISSSLKGNMQLVVTDINGRIIQTQNIQISAGNQQVSLDAGRLASGMFQLTGYINGERTATVRFIKQ